MPRRTAFGLLAAALAGAWLLPWRATAQLVERPEEELLLLSLQLRHQRLADAIPAWPAADDVLLPLGEVARHLGFALDVDATAGTVRGLLGGEDHTFRLDAAERRVDIAGRVAAWEAGEVEVHREDVFVASRLLARWLPIDLAVDLRAATVTVTPREPLPIELREQRHSRGAALPGVDRRESFPAREVPRHLAGLPAADLQARLATGTETDSTETHFSAFVTGDLLFMDAAVFAAGSAEDSAEELRWSLARRDPHGDLLGPLAATEVVFGESLFPGLDLVAPASSGRGFLLSNHPLQRPEQFDRHTLQGPLPPGWEVELFRDEALLGFASGDDEGFYLFADVPLRFGLNVFRLVFHGPRGERREEEQVIHVGERQAPRGVFRYRLAAQDPEVRSQRSLLELDYGIGRALSVGLAAATVEIDDVRHEYAKASLRGSWSRMLGMLDWSEDSAGGSALQVSLLTRWRSLGVFLQHAELDDFHSDAFRGTLPDLERRSVLRLDGTLPKLRFLPLALELRRDEVATGGSLTELRGRLSASRRRLFVTNELSWLLPEGVPGLGRSGRGRLLVSRFGLRHALRGGLTYAVAPEWELETVDLELQRHIGRGYQLFAGAQQQLGSDQTRLRLGARQLLGAFGWSLGIDAADDGDVRATATVNVGVTPDPLGRGWETDARPLAALGTAAVAVFLDLDGDGARSPDEPPLEEVGFLVGGLPDPTRTDATGTAFLARLPTYRPLSLEIATGTLEDPMWMPTVEGVEIVPRPGATVIVDFPVVGTGEVTGTVRVASGEEAWEGAGWRVELIDADGEVAAETIAAYDGFFSLDRIRPGSYRLRARPPGGWEVRAAPEIALHVDAAGSILDGRDLLVEVAPIDPPAGDRVATGEEELPPLPFAGRPAEPPPAAPTPDSRADVAPLPVDPAASTGPRWGVQLSSVGDPRVAAAVANRLSAELDLPAAVVRADLGEHGVWYRVVVGARGSRSQAEQLRRLLAPSRPVGPVLLTRGGPEDWTVTGERAWAVQVASLRRSEIATGHARELAERLERPVCVTVVDLADSGRWHRVLVGWLPDAVAAERLRTELAGAGLEVGPVRRRPARGCQSMP